MESIHMNAEMYITFARFCEFIMSFELEAETFYLKGLSIVNSQKLNIQ